MATFEAAAEALVKEIGKFQVDDEAKLLETLKGQVEELSEGLDEDWEDFLEAVFALLDEVEEQEKRLLGETTEAVEGLATIPKAIDDKAEALKTALNEGGAALAGVEKGTKELGEKVAEQMDEQADDVAKALGERATDVTEGLHTSFEALTTSVGETLVGELQSEAAFAEMFGKAAKTIPERTSRKLSAIVEEWNGRIAGLADQTKNVVFDKGGAQADKAVDAAMDACEETHRETFDELWGVIDEARGYLDALRAEVEQKHEGAEEHEPTMAAEADDLKAALEKAVNELWAMYEFLAERGHLPKG